MGRHTSTGLGQYHAGRRHVAFLPNSGRFLHAMLFCTGNAASATATLASNFYGQFSALADAGIAVICGDLSSDGKSWGNDASTTELEELRAYLTSQYGHPAATVSLLGGSMGGLTGLNYYRRFPAKVTRIGLIIPAIDLQQFHDNATFTAEINTAYTNQAGFDAAVGTHSGLAIADDIAVDTKIWYSTDDPLCDAADVLALDAANNFTTIESLGAVGHNGDLSVLPAQSILDWFAAA